MEKGTFTCDTCEKQYANRDSLRVHMKTHHISVQSGFVCEVCGCVIVTAGPEGAHTCVANSDSQVYNNNTQMYPALSPAIGCEGEWQEDWHGGGFDDSSRFPQVRQEQVNTRVLVMETRHSHAGHSQAEHSQTGDSQGGHSQAGYSQAGYSQYGHSQAGQFQKAEYSQPGPSHRDSKDWKISEIGGRMFYDL